MCSDYYNVLFKYTVVSKDGKKFVVHHDHIKRCALPEGPRTHSLPVPESFDVSPIIVGREGDLAPLARGKIFNPPWARRIYYPFKLVEGGQFCDDNMLSY